jgi:hypothetical protein
MAHQNLGRPLGDKNALTAVLKVTLDDRHHFAVRTERYLANAFEALLAAVMDTELALSHQKYRFGRIALDFPAVVFLLSQARIAGQTAPAQHDDLLRAKVSFRNCTTFWRHLSVWPRFHP